MKNQLHQLFNYLRSPSNLRREFVVLFAFTFVFTNSLFAQNTLDHAGLTSATPAAAAYGMRKLSSAYSGFALQVRRSPDNATQDVGFTAGGDLDTASLKTFVGGGNGYVTTWYDQSGNGKNLSQAINSQQPVLVASGVINREQKKPFIRFWGVVSTSYNSLNLPTAMTTVGHVSAVVRFVAGGYGFLLSHTGAVRWHSTQGSFMIDPVYASTSVQNGSAWHNGNATAPTSLPWPTTLSLVELAPQNPSSATDWDNIGNDRYCCHFLSGGSGYSELILFSSALPPTDRQNMETNQKNYFSIGITLPLSWLSFTVEPSNDAALLKWQTAWEKNTQSFIVERSSNGVNWTEVASINAVGETTQTNSYRYQDNSPLPGMNYYRIKAVDADGKTGYSIIKTNRFLPKQQLFTVINNLSTTNRISMRVTKETNIALYSSDGRMIWIKKFGTGVQTISLNQNSKGLYWLVAEGCSQKIFIQ
jgi:hypothetical protein